MEFKSLNDAFTNNFIKSLPHLTRLDLSANQIKLIELVLSYTRNGQSFYMNHSDIAEYLVLKSTKTKAKSVGNIIRQLKKKGYVNKTQTHNFNGKNGGSSVTITVDENYLEQQLNAVFNPCLTDTENIAEAPTVEPLEQNLSYKIDDDKALAESEPEVVKMTVARLQTNDDFLAELEAMDDEPRPILNLPSLKEFAYPDDIDEENEQESYGYMEIDTTGDFKALLYRLLRLDSMRSKRDALLHLIDNKPNYDLEKLKEGFEALVLNPIY